MNLLFPDIEHPLPVIRRWANGAVQVIARRLRLSTHAGRGQRRGGNSGEGQGSEDERGCHSLAHGVGPPGAVYALQTSLAARRIAMEHSSGRRPCSPVQDAK